MSPISGRTRLQPPVGLDPIGVGCGRTRAPQARLGYFSRRELSADVTGPSAVGAADDSPVIHRGVSVDFMAGAGFCRRQVELCLSAALPVLRIATAMRAFGAIT